MEEDEGFAQNMRHILDAVESSMAAHTGLKPNGLPEICGEARISLGQFLTIPLSRYPTPSEFTSVAHHFKDFATKNGRDYKMRQSRGNACSFITSLGHGDSISEYEVSWNRRKDSYSLDFMQTLGCKPNLLPAYCDSLFCDE